VSRSTAFGSLIIDAALRLVQVLDPRAVRPPVRAQHDSRVHHLEAGEQLLQLGLINAFVDLDVGPCAGTVSNRAVAESSGSYERFRFMNAANASGGEQGLGPTARRMILGSQLRRLRERAAITRAEAGYNIRGSESKISRLELGRVGFKERDVADLLTMYGVTVECERRTILDMVKESNQPGWWRRYHDLMPGWFDDFVGLEEAATRIQTWEPLYVPGLLQTEEYARGVASHGQPERADDAVDRRVALRMRRQKLLAKPDAPSFWAVIDESVLHRPIGGRKALRAQVAHLLEVTALPNVSVQVLPWHNSGYAAEGAFALLRFAEPELPNIVYVEHLTGALYLEKLDDVEAYSRSLDRLAVDAETPDRSRQLLMKRLAEI
jgi:hypothetical protein